MSLIVISYFSIEINCYNFFRDYNQILLSLENRKPLLKPHQISPVSTIEVRLVLDVVVQGVEIKPPSKLEVEK